MPPHAGASPPRARRSASLLASIVIAGLMLGALWFATQRLPRESATAPTQVGTADAANAWPTVPATFTPLATPTAPVVATPTPLPLPSWQEIGEFATIEYYDSIDSEVIRNDWAPGKDSANIRVVASVKLGIDLNQAQAASLRPEHYAITITLPRVKILSVTYLPARSEILDVQQQWVLSSYPGLEKAAMDQGLAEIRRRADSNEKMFSIAAEITSSRIERLLRSYGFRTVEVRFQQ